VKNSVGNLGCVVTLLLAPLRDTSGYNTLQQSQTKTQIERNFQKAGQDLLEKPTSYLRNTLKDQMSQLDEMTRMLKEKGLAGSPNMSEGRRSNYPAHINGPIERQTGYDPYQSSFAVTIGHSHSADLRSSFQPFAYRPEYRGTGLQALNAITESSERGPADGLSSTLGTQQNFNNFAHYPQAEQNLIEEPEENKLLEDSFKREPRGPAAGFA
jgi:hypothetical protein